MSSTQRLTKWIKDDIPCIFAKYGDGEYRCANFWDGANNEATNESGFTGLPGGATVSGGFFSKGSQGYWWSSTGQPGQGGQCWYRTLDNNNGIAGRGYGEAMMGMSVRCLKD